MPSTNLSSKTKADLAVLAELSGLLTQTQAKKMTKAAIIEFLETAEQKSKEQKADKQKTGKQKTNLKEAEPQTEKQTAGRKRTSGGKKPAKTPQSQTEKESQAKAGARANTKSRTGADTKTSTSSKDNFNVEAEPDSAVSVKTEADQPLLDSLEKSADDIKPVAARKSRTVSKKTTSAREETKSVSSQKDTAVDGGKTEPEQTPVQAPLIPDTAEDSQIASSDRTGAENENGTDVSDKPEASVEQQSAEQKQPVEQKRNVAHRHNGNNQKHDKSADLKQNNVKPNDDNKPRRPIVEAGELVSGALEIMPDGYGFLRKDNYLQGSKDIYVPPQYIRRFGLRTGDLVVGPGKQQRDTDRYQALLYIKEVNGMPPEKMVRRPQFDRLTPIYPDSRYRLETARNELSTRIIDLAAPIGKGQRGMIVSPPKAGKTILLQKIANAISLNNPEVKLIVLLIDERPEEVTDMQRSIKGEVVYSTFDKTPENHVKVTELVLERAMRLVELKQDVVILLDSMTRLARAYNLTINPTGRTLSGGLDPGALYGPKRFFGAARNIENGGSLTIIATSLIETGSRMDEVIFEEFKGTGNMEVYLDRKLSEKRIFPAIDINRSGTRREELLMTGTELDAVWTIRKAFSQLDTASVTETIINLLLKTQNNDHFISSINVSFNDKNVFDAMRGNRTGNGNAPAGGQGNTNGKQY
jgi:transcription termination factor Rho